jgi:NAD(P)-dependent dehydrogenase (short-subunit alcohol dehydrogenase family)
VEPHKVDDRFRLDGRVALVTGASTGIGVEIARTFAAVGAKVVLVARRESLLADAVDSIRAVGGEALAIPADITDPEACDRAASSAIEHFGRLDVLVNNAGIGTAVPALKEEPAAFRRVVDINLNGTYYMSQACARKMAPGSSIVNVSSALALTTAGLPQAAYAASKAAVLGLTRDLAQQWSGRKGIRVNAVAPGFVSTEMTSSFPAGYMESQVARFPISRPGDTHEIATAVLFLASNASSYVTGTTLSVDGGMAIS